MGDAARSIILILLDIQKPIMYYKIRANNTHLLSITDKGVVYNAYSVYVDTPLPLVAVGHTYFK